MRLRPSESGLLAKVCGMTRPADVEAALGAGADLVGFVSFSASPRHLEDAQVAALSAALEDRPSRGVLVTVDRPRASVECVLKAPGLVGVQLCGGEAPGDWTDAPFLILRRVSAGPGAVDEIGAWAGIADAFVIDHPGAPGGTGRRVPLEEVLPAIAAGPAFLAGGLGPDMLEAGLNAELIDAGLLGVDASSGLESAPGTKSRAAIHRFVAAAHSLPRVTP